MKTLQNIAIAVVFALVIAGMFTDGWLSVWLCTAAATVAIAAIALANKK